LSFAHAKTFFGYSISIHFLCVGLFVQREQAKSDQEIRPMRIRSAFERLAKLALTCLAVLGTTGASASETSATAQKITVVATLAPIADWVRNIGGNAVEVYTLCPPGTSPHTFEPSPADLKKTAKCRLFVSVGLGLDNWAAQMSRSNPSSLSVALGEQLLKAGKLPKDLPVPPQLGGGDASENHDHEHGEGHGHSHDHGGVDPHFWLDPVLAMAAIDEITTALLKAAPERVAVWKEGAARYRKQLEELHRDISEQLASCKGQKLITFHHAFGYFAKRYGLDVAGVIEAYPGKQPSERELKNLVEQLRSLGVKTIFSEPQLDARLARIVAQEIGGRVGTLDPEGTAERSTYIELMRFNAEQLKKALCP
jgi:ABC-type Zn uptake system ZnuABC Zn-binding protein ZnuA